MFRYGQDTSVMDGVHVPNGDFSQLHYYIDGQASYMKEVELGIHPEQVWECMCSNCQM